MANWMVTVSYLLTHIWTSLLQALIIIGDFMILANFESMSLCNCEGILSWIGMKLSGVVKNNLGH